MPDSEVVPEAVNGANNDDMQVVVVKRGRGRPRKAKQTVPADDGVRMANDGPDTEVVVPIEANI